MGRGGRDRGEEGKRGGGGRSVESGGERRCRNGLPAAARGRVERAGR